MSFEAVEYRGEGFLLRYIVVYEKGSHRCYCVGSDRLFDAIHDIRGEIHPTAEGIDKRIFHYIAEKTLREGSDEDIIKEIEADDVPREDW